MLTLPATGTDGLATKNIVIDTIAPTLAIGGPSGSYAAGGPITYTVAYADANFNTSSLAVNNVTLNKTGTADGIVAVSGMGLTRTVTISNISGDGNLGISIAADTASDLAGNLAPAAGPSTTFTVDNTPPKSTVTFPMAASYNAASWMGSISGTAADTGGSGLSEIQVSIKRDSDNEYWDGAAFDQSSESFLNASGTTNWTLAFAAANLANGVSYTVHSQANDNAGNVETGPTATFTYNSLLQNVELRWSGAGSALGLTETTSGATPTIVISEPAPNISLLKIDLGTGHAFAATSTTSATGLTYQNAGSPSTSQYATIDISHADNVGLPASESPRRRINPRPDPRSQRRLGWHRGQCRHHRSDGRRYFRRQRQRGPESDR